MKYRKVAILAVFAVASLSAPVYAGEHEPAHESKAYPHPVLSENPNWASKLLLGVMGAFILAIGVGAISKYRPDAGNDPAPDNHAAHGHDEHGHGHDEHAQGHH